MAFLVIPSPVLCVKLAKSYPKTTLTARIITLPATLQAFEADRFLKKRLSNLTFRGWCRKMVSKGHNGVSRNQEDRMTEVVGFSQKGFVRLPAVLKMFPVGKSTWWAGVKSGKFPPAIKLGRNTTAWRVEDIERLVESFR